jgi:integrase
VPKIRLHDLRHSHATLLLAAGQPLKVVSERLGHSKTSITLDTYAHVLPDMQDQAVDALGAILFGPKSA